MDVALRYLKASDFLSRLKECITLLKSDFNVPISDGLVADDSPVIKSLMMSASRLILGYDSGYGAKYEALRSAVIKKLVG